MVYGEKFLVDLMFGKQARHTLEDKERRQNARAQGLSRRQYEMMAPFDIPRAAAGAVSFPRRLPIPPNRLPLVPRPPRGLGHPPYPLHGGHPPICPYHHHHNQWCHLGHGGRRPGRHGWGPHRHAPLFDDDDDDDLDDLDDDSDSEDDDLDLDDDLEESLFDEDRHSYVRSRLHPRHRRHDRRGIRGPGRHHPSLGMLLMGIRADTMVAEWEGILTSWAVIQGTVTLRLM